MTRFRYGVSRYYWQPVGIFGRARYWSRHDRGSLRWGHR